jgi:hypothetical protein
MNGMPRPQQMTINISHSQIFPQSSWDRATAITPYVIYIIHHKTLLIRINIKYVRKNVLKIVLQLSRLLFSFHCIGDVTNSFTNIGNI